MSLFRKWMASKGEGGASWLKQMDDAYSKYGGHIDVLLEGAKNFKGTDGSDQIGWRGAGWKDAISLAVAQMGPPPKDDYGKREWTKKVYKAALVAAAGAEKELSAGHVSEAGVPDAEYNQALSNEFGTSAQALLDSSDTNGIADGTYFTESSDMLVDADAGGTLSGPSTEQDPAIRLKQFYDAIYNPQTASRISQMAGNQARRASQGAGVRGGLSDASVAYQGQNALLGYDQNVNAQALQYMGMENQQEMGMAQLAQQNAQFNAQQRAIAAQNAYGQRQQMGGTIGGAVGGVVGGIVQGYTGAPVMGAFTAAGTGIGSIAGGGQAPGAYTVKGMGSLAKSGATSSKNNNGIV